MNHAGVMHFAVAPALGNHLLQIEKPHIGAEALNYILFSMSTRAPAFRAGQPDYFGWVLAKPQ